MAQVLDRKARGSRVLMVFVKVIVVVCLASAAFYLGWRLFVLKSSREFECLSMICDDGVLLYNRGEELPDADFGWEPVELGPKPKITGASGESATLDGIYKDPSKIAPVRITIGPDGKVTSISGILDGFTFEDEVQSTGGGEIIFSGKKYILDEQLSLEAEKGDIVKAHGMGDTVIYAHLVEKAGTLQVFSNVDGAKVFLDGVYLGVAPVRINVAPGVREVTAKASGYKNESMQVTLQSKETLQVSLDMLEISGTLEIDSTPVGAHVFVDGLQMGVTPASLGLPPGDHELLVKKPGYYSKKASVTIRQDAVTPIDLTLVAEVSSLFPEKSGLPSFSSDRPKDPDVGWGQRMTVLSYDDDSFVLKALDEGGSVSDLTIPRDVMLGTLFLGEVSWNDLLPGEDILVETDSLGYVHRAAKASQHEFSAKGRVMDKKGSKIMVGDTWDECTLAYNVVIQEGPAHALVGNVNVGDVIAAYGKSAGDIKHVVIERSSEAQSSLEGYLVKVGDETRIFSGGQILPLRMSRDLTVSDLKKRTVEKVSGTPLGSKLRFHLDSERNVVWAEYIWKANLSTEGRIARMSGPVLSILPTWEEAVISLDTLVFFDGAERPFYDVKVGDKVLVAGPLGEDVRFILITERLDFDKVMEGFMGAAGGKGSRVFNEVDGSRGITQWVFDTGTTFVDPDRKQSYSLDRVNHGDQVRLWLDVNAKPVWGEIIQRNEIGLNGHYLGEREGVWYFSGFQGFVPTDDLVLTGLFKNEELREGSKVYVGGRDRQLDYLEVQQLAKPARWVDGTVISVEKDSVTLMRGRHSVAEYHLFGDVWYVDWKAGVDGSAQGLSVGDEVRLGLDYARQVVFIERDHCPRFKIKGMVTAVSGRNLALSGDYGALRVSLHSRAVVYKKGEISDYRQIELGDELYLSGSSGDLVDFVVGTP